MEISVVGQFSFLMSYEDKCTHTSKEYKLCPRCTLGRIKKRLSFLRREVKIYEAAAYWAAFWISYNFLWHALPLVGFIIQAALLSSLDSEPAYRPSDESILYRLWGQPAFLPVKLEVNRKNTSRMTTKRRKSKSSFHIHESQNTKKKNKKNPTLFIY